MCSFRSVSGVYLVPCLSFIVKNKFGLPDAAEFDIYDETDTAVEEDILLELIEANPDLCLTVRDRISDEGRFHYEVGCNQCSGFFC